METARATYEISGKISAGTDALEYRVVFERQGQGRLYEAKWSLVNTQTGFELSGKLPVGSYESIRQMIERFIAGCGYADLLKLFAWFK